jgi:L-threonylcarbamoyladenylate synthase
MKEDLLQNEISKSLRVLKEGGIILYPTDTIWGIGCDASNKEAIDRIYELKQRPDSKSVISLLDDSSKLIRYVKEVPAMAWDLVENTTRPLTIIYPGVVNIAPNAIAPDGTAGIRITTHQFCRQLVRELGKPLISTSANISGNPSPASFSEIDQAILNGVDYIVNLPADESTPQRPSTIIKLGLDGTIQFIRK